MNHYIIRAVATHNIMQEVRAKTLWNSNSPMANPVHTYLGASPSELRWAYFWVNLHRLENQKQILQLQTWQNLDETIYEVTNPNWLLLTTWFNTAQCCCWVLPPPRWSTTETHTQSWQRCWRGGIPVAQRAMKICACFRIKSNLSWGTGSLLKMCSMKSWGVTAARFHFNFPRTTSSHS